jgi:hypothetical protein
MNPTQVAFNQVQSKISQGTVFNLLKFKAGVSAKENFGGRGGDGVRNYRIKVADLSNIWGFVLSR